MIEQRLIAALYDVPVEVVTASREKADHIFLAAWKYVARLPVSIEFFDDYHLPHLRFYSREEWDAQVMRLRGIRRALDRQPLAHLKRAATLAIKHAERVQVFPHSGWELPHRWYDLDDEGRPKELD